MRKLETLVFAVASLSASRLNAAQPPVVTLNLTNVNASQANLGGVYTSPYTGNIGGGPTIPVICDDFTDNSYIPETWQAYDSSLASLGNGAYGTPDSYVNYLTSAGSTVSVGGQQLNQAQAYTVAAYLAVELVEQNQSIPAQETNAEYLSYALWGLFDPTLFQDGNGTNSCTLPGGEGCISSAALTAAKNDLNTAVTYVMNNSLTATNFVSHLGINSVDIYSYNKALNPNGPTNCNGPCPPPPQEFIAVSMTEPAASAMLGIDLLGAGGLVLFVRRRRARTSTRA